MRSRSRTGFAAASCRFVAIAATVAACSAPSEPADSGPGSDAQAADRAVVPDAAPLDGATPDATPADAAAPDAAPFDAAVRDTAMSDTATPDTAMPDVATADSATFDAARPDVVSLDAAARDVTALDVSTPDVSVRDAAADVTATDAARSDVTSTGTVTPGNPCLSRFPMVLGGTGNAASGDCTLATGGRTYRLHVPLNYRPGVSALVLVLHGQGGTSMQMETASQWSAKSDAVGFAVAYPMATTAPGRGTLWDAYYFESQWPAPPDDSAYLRQVITEVSAMVQPDSRRLFITGMSSGAYMTHRAGVELADIVAAVAPVSGLLGSVPRVPPRTIPAPVRPVSVLMLHGDMDANVPYCGGTGMSNDALGLDDAFDFWSRGASCTNMPATPTMCTARGGTITAATERAATGCAPGTAVQIYRLINGIHFYYTTRMDRATDTPHNPAFGPVVGATTVDVTWNFFAAHPR